MAVEERYDPNSTVYRRTTVLEQLSLQGKTVVITGGARGLGLAIARACAEFGGNLALLDVLPEPTDELKLLDELKIEWKYYQVDVRDYEALKATYESIEKSFVTIDCLVNSAGIAHRGDFVDFDLQGIENVMDVNVVGTITNTQFAIRNMLAHGKGGSIVNISSIGGHIQVPGRKNCVYSATKGAVRAFTKSLAAEYAERNIRVNCISPGFFTTAPTAGADLQKFFGEFERFIPMRRFADRAEMKGLAAFLLSPASSYITGEDIVIDGGVLTI